MGGLLPQINIMGANKSTSNIIVKTLTGDGSTGFWWFAAKPADSNIYQMDYAGKNSVVSKTEKLDWAETFYEAVDDLQKQGDILPLIDQKVNVNATGPTEHFRDLTNTQVSDIAGWYDPQVFCEKMGALKLIERFLNRSFLAWEEAETSLIYLGQNKKVYREEVQTELELMNYNGDITQKQIDDFWYLWEYNGLI